MLLSKLVSKLGYVSSQNLFTTFIYVSKLEDGHLTSTLAGENFFWDYGMTNQNFDLAIP